MLQPGQRHLGYSRALRAQLRADGVPEPYQEPPMSILDRIQSAVANGARFFVCYGCPKPCRSCGVRPYERCQQDCEYPRCNGRGIATQGAPYNNTDHEITWSSTRSVFLDTQDATWTVDDLLHYMNIRKQVVVHITNLLADIHQPGHLPYLPDTARYSPKGLCNSFCARHNMGQFCVARDCDGVHLCNYLWCTFPGCQSTRNHRPGGEPQCYPIIF